MSTRLGRARKGAENLASSAHLLQLGENMDVWAAKSEKSQTTPEAVDPKSLTNFAQKEPNFLERVNNRIYFYSEVDREKVLQLNKNIRELNGDLAHKQKDFGFKEVPKIYVHLNSFGGSIFAGLASVDEILRSDLPVTTIVDGCAASAATLISIVGKERLINRHAFMLVHQLSSMMWGKYADLKDGMENVDRLMTIIKDLYKNHTKIPEAKIDEILKHDLWWDAKTCLKYGLVDGII